MIPTPADRLPTRPITSPKGPLMSPLDLELLYNAVSIANMRWAADGRHLFIESNVSGRYNIWRIPARGGWPVRMTISEERTTVWDPSPDGKWLLYSVDEGGNEKPNLFLMPAIGGQAVNLTNTRGVGYRGMQWSKDGRSLCFAGDRETLGSYGAYVMDVEGREIRKVAGNTGGECLIPRWSRDGKHLALTRTIDYLHTGVSVLDIATGDERTLIPIDGETSTFVTGWTRDGARLLITSDRNEVGTTASALLDVGSGAIEWLTLGPWDTFAFDLSPTEDRILYVRNVGGEHTAFLRDLSGAAETQVKLPPGVLYLARFNGSGDAIAMLHSAGAGPTEIWRYDVARGSPHRVTRSLPAGLDPAGFTTPTHVTYSSFDGTRISAWMYMPRNLRRDGSHPAIVYPHGGPTAQHTNRWHADIQHLVSEGFLVIAPDYRGSSGFGRPFREANKHDLGGGDLKDVIAAAEYLKASGYVDPRRVAIMGASYGGYLTLMALTKDPDRWAAGVAVVPFANWFTEYEHEDPFLQAFDRSLMGDPVKNADLWRDRSPIFFVDRIKAPLLLLAGANDIRCPAEETTQIVEALKKRGRPVEAKIYEHEGHGFSRRENLVDSARRTADFLLKNMAATGR